MGGGQYAGAATAWNGHTDQDDTQLGTGDLRAGRSAAMSLPTTWPRQWTNRRHVLVYSILPFSYDSADVWQARGVPLHPGAEQNDCRKKDNAEDGSMSTELMLIKRG